MFSIVMWHFNQTTFFFMSIAWSAYFVTLMNKQRFGFIRNDFQFFVLFFLQVSFFLSLSLSGIFLYSLFLSLSHSVFSLSLSPFFPSLISPNNPHLSPFITSSLLFLFLYFNYHHHCSKLLHKKNKGFRRRTRNNRYQTHKFAIT